MLFRKTKKEDRYPIAMGSPGAYRLVGIRPVEPGCGSYFGSMEKNPTVGGQGGLPPWAASPTGGERGSPSQFLRQLKKREGISTEPISDFTREILYSRIKKGKYQRFSKD
jgi:hypothetical protein